MSVLTAVLRHALIPPLRNALTDPSIGGGGGVPEGLRLLAENGDTLITEASDQLIKD